LTFHSPVLPMRATAVAGIAVAFGLLALANLSPGPLAGVAQEPQVRAPIVAPAVRAPLALACADALNR
jgi:hypothetical protein